jgi:hypothetical protein
MVTLLLEMDQPDCMLLASSLRGHPAILDCHMFLIVLFTVQLKSKIFCFKRHEYALYFIKSQ